MILLEELELVFQTTTVVVQQNARIRRRRIRMEPDLEKIAEELIKHGSEIIQPTTSVQEAEAIKDKFASSVTINIYNFLREPLLALRAVSRAGEIEVPVSDIPSLSRSALLCGRLTRPVSSCGCAGTVSFGIGSIKENLHVMWSSPNNFDKLASHLAVGISQEKSDKFIDMYYNHDTWFTRKYVYHDSKGIWFHSPHILIFAKSSTRPVADVDVYVYPMNPDNLPKEAKEVVKSLL
ncbi:uncharacterized protein LOC111714894 [Eurytemora carolleeae]|uniref:uncharacterized protein LOC111714894 n=1 Tax=Eurytemora carolleeae TaxID=1294199 RepID=UPI000C76F40F|nr:uncharacterized protein LOC111714894 [Eurytemora carolleeae]|eukprot:XP_023345876.1 uncharacterized protein LOC111714894 [Eurytemora affinis]